MLRAAPPPSPSLPPASPAPRASCKRVFEYPMGEQRCGRIYSDAEYTTNALSAVEWDGCSSDPEIHVSVRAPQQHPVGAHTPNQPRRAPLHPPHQHPRTATHLKHSPLRESASADSISRFEPAYQRQEQQQHQPAAARLHASSVEMAEAVEHKPLVSGGGGSGSMIDLHSAKRTAQARGELSASVDSFVPRSRSVCGEFSTHLPASPSTCSASAMLAAVAPQQHNLEMPLLVREFPLHDAAANTVHREATLLDASTQLFGLDALHRKMLANISDSKRLPIVYRDGHAVAVQRFFYSQAPEGSGVRTLTYNFCLQHRINLLIVKAPAIHEEYARGTYMRIVERAVALAPCVVLIDRLDQHWDRTFFRACGAELLSAWERLREVRQAMGAPLPDVWFVISNAIALSDCDLAVFKALYHNLCVAQPLSAEQCVEVLSQTYATCMLDIGAMEDDRPAPLPSQPPPTARQEDAYRAALRQCNYSRKLDAVAPLFRDIGHAIHRSGQMHTVTDERNAVHPMPVSVRPEWLADIVKRAFVKARERYSHERRVRGTLAAQNPAEAAPTRAEFAELVRAMPFPFELQPIPSMP